MPIGICGMPSSFCCCSCCSICTHFLRACYHAARTIYPPFTQPARSPATRRAPKPPHLPETLFAYRDAYSQAHALPPVTSAAAPQLSQLVIATTEIAFTTYFTSNNSTCTKPERTTAPIPYCVVTQLTAALVCSRIFCSAVSTAKLISAPLSIAPHPTPSHWSATASIISAVCQTLPSAPST